MMKTTPQKANGGDLIWSALRVTPADFAAPYIRHAARLEKRGPLVLVKAMNGAMEIVQGYNSEANMRLADCIATDLRPRHLCTESHAARCYWPNWPEMPVN